MLCLTCVGHIAFAFLITLKPYATELGVQVTQDSDIQEPWRWVALSQACPEAAVGMSAGLLKAWLSCRIHFQDGSLPLLVRGCWLLAGGLSSLPQGPLHSVASGSL